MRESFLPFHRPSIDEGDIAAVVHAMRSGWLTSGPGVLEFERAFAAFVGAEHAVAVNSCTAALHLALEAMGVGKGDEVILPTMTFAATAEVVTYLQARPVLVDCCPSTLNMTAGLLEPALTNRTRAIIAVHHSGLPCDLDPILDLARSRGVAVVEDAAHCFPAAYRGRMIGAISDATCFSFYATKTITTGEGGMVTTQSASQADRMRLMRLHGISRHAWNRYADNGTWRYEILEAGFKYNLTDIAAALGSSQLAKARTLGEARRRHAEQYSKALQDVPEIEVPPSGLDGEHAWHLYVIKLNLERLRIGRDQFIEELRERRIGASVHFIPLHLHPYYRTLLGCRPDEYPAATAVFERIVSLPLFPDMSSADVADAVAAVTDIVRSHHR